MTAKADAVNSIPSNLARVPTLLASRLALGSITGSQKALLDIESRITSGRRVERPSDDVVAASAIAALDDRIERSGQRATNLAQADALLGSVDAALSDLNDLLLEAKGIGLSQIGIGSDAATRRNQAAVVDELLRSALEIGNRAQRGIHLFGGDAHGAPPFVTLDGTVRYVGQGAGMQADLGPGQAIRLTMGAEEAFGALSGRVQGFVDLDPGMIGTTRLADLDGARGQGIARTTLRIAVNAVETTVDLSDAETVSDVIVRVNAAIQALDPGASFGIDGGDPSRFALTPSAGVTVVISDPSTPGGAADLGLVGTYLGGVATSGGDVDPKLTDLTPLGAIAGLSTPLGSIRIRNAGQTREIDLSSAATVQDIMNLVAAQSIGVRIEVDPSGRLNARNELSGAVMSIEEIAGGTTATELGIRSLHGSTRLADFNAGRGVASVSGSSDPVTGLPDPTLDLDFRVTLKDGRSFDVDLGASATVQDVLDAINAAAAGAGVLPAEFAAGLASDGNGIALTDLTAGTTTSVVDLNGSPAAEQLGILGSTDGATLIGQDRATVAVESVFSRLIALRDALLADDEAGISFATERLDVDLGRAIEARADIGVRARRVADATAREEDLSVLDQSLRSQVRDLDMTEAAIRFSNLQQILQASYQVAARSRELSLLDFLR